MERIVIVQRFDILSIGAVVQDTFIQAPQIKLIDYNETESGQALLLPLGAKLDVSVMQHEVGGGAANSSVAFSRVGLQAGIISRIGKDFAGRLVKEVLEHEGVESRFLKNDGHLPTGQSVLILSPDGNRTVLVKRGASAAFTINDVDESFLRRTGWIYMSSIGGNLDVLQYIFGICHVHGVKVAWNPGALELALGERHLRPLLAQADVLLVNREEAAHLTQLPHGSVDNVLAQLMKLVKNGVVVVTNGAEGASAFDGTHIETLPGRDIKVVDATGAGDSFGSGFVAAHILGLGVDRALSFAIANAESVIGSIGAQTGLLRKAVLERQRIVKGIVTQ
jgi:sugar/nucleoside kinase (ribokinase family)